MVIGVPCGLGPSGIDDDDLPARDLVVPDPLPDDRMGHHGVGSDKDNCVGKLKIIQCIAGRVVPQRSLVGYRRGGHTEPGIAVHVGLQEVAHDVAEDGELLQGQLPGADTGNALPSVFGLQFPDLVRDIFESFIPGHLLEAPVLLPDLGEGVGLYGRLLLAQRQSLDTAESIVDWIAFRRDSLDDPAIFYVKIQVAVDGTKIARRLYLPHGSSSPLVLLIMVKKSIFIISSISKNYDICSTFCIDFVYYLRNPCYD